MRAAREGAAVWAAWDRAVQVWLFVVAGLVLLMIVVGGATRLTDSGLSITEWQPILGAIPPLSEADWQAAFAKYKEIPEYHLVNKGMSLEAFKSIYWWEWSHRFLGRFIGVAFALPFAFFLDQGRAATGHRAESSRACWRSALCRARIGWFMVKSGLVDRVDVSQYRLALHLSIAFLILGLSAVARLRSRGRRASRARGLRFSRGQTRLRRCDRCAGVRCRSCSARSSPGSRPVLPTTPGRSWTAHWCPEGLGALSPWYLNFFENVTTVQFNHRLMAYAVTAARAVAGLGVCAARSANCSSRSATWLAAAVAVSGRCSESGRCSRQCRSRSGFFIRPARRSFSA